jgi:hypothetical protein
VTEEPRILFCSDPVVDKDKPVAIFNQQTAHGPNAQIIFIRWIGFLPDGFGNHAKHSASIQFEQSCFNNV